MKNFAYARLTTISFSARYIMKKGTYCQKYWVLSAKEQLGLRGVTHLRPERKPHPRMGFLPLSICKHISVQCSMRGTRQILKCQFSWQCQNFCWLSFCIRHRLGSYSKMKGHFWQIAFSQTQWFLLFCCQDCCCHQYEWNLVQISRCFHHHIHSTQARPCKWTF